MPFIAILVGLLALGGSAVIQSGSPESQSGGVNLASAQIAEAVQSLSSESEGTVVDSAISRDQAIVAAQARFAGTVGRVEQETEDGVLVWKVRIVSAEGVRADIEVNATTGEITRFKSLMEDIKLNDDDKDEDVPSSTVTEVTRNEAIAIAKGKLDGNVVKTELESEDGILVWNVRIVKSDGTVNQRADVRINASTEEILRLRIRDINGHSGKKLTASRSLSSGDDNGDDDGSGRGGDDVEEEGEDNSGSGHDEGDDNEGDNSGSGSSGRDHDEDD